MRRRKGFRCSPAHRFEAKLRQSSKKTKEWPTFFGKGGEKMRLGLNLSTLDEAHDAFCVAVVAVWIIMARKTVAKQQAYGLV